MAVQGSTLRGEEGRLAASFVVRGVIEEDEHSQHHDGHPGWNKSTKKVEEIGENSNPVESCAKTSILPDSE